MDTSATSDAVPIEYRLGRFRLLPAEHRLLVDGEAANLGPRALSLLVLLVEHAGQLVTKDDILSRVWPGLVVEENNLQVQVSTLRKILGHEAIVTVPGVGYRFVLPVDAPPAKSGASPRALPLADRRETAIPAADLGEMGASKPAPARGIHAGSRHALIAVSLLGVLSIVAIALWTVPQFTKTATPSAPAMSMIILPFAVAGGGAVEEQIADALTKDLTGGFARIRGVTVVSYGPVSTLKGKVADARAVGREFNVRYLLDGTVRRDGGRITVAAQLIDSGTAAPVWGDQYPLDEARLSDGQSSTVTQLTQRLRAALFDAEKRRVAAQPSARASALDISLRAYNVWDKESDPLTGALAARALFEEALRLDPNLMEALFGRGATLLDEMEFSRNAEFDRLVQELDRLSKHAVAVDRNDSRAWQLRTHALARQFRWDAALEANTRASQLDPTRALLLRHRANLMGFIGKPGQILPLVDQALALDPLDVGSAIRLRCRAYMLLGQYRDAIAACEKAVAFDDSYITYLYLVAAYSHEGEAAKADAAKVALLKRRPGFSIADIKAARLSDVPAYWRQVEAHVFSGLRKAGIPEQ